MEPVEGDGSTCVQGHEGKRGPEEDEDGRPKRSASTVNVREEAGGVTLFGKRTQCTGTTVNTRETDRNDRQHDDDVGEVGESNDAGAFSHDDERRGFDIDETTAEEPGVGVWDQQTNKGQ